MMSPDAAKNRLKHAPWLAAPGLSAIFAVLDARAGRTRAVGGAVRDTLMDREHAKTDVDLATELTPEEVMQRAEAAGLKSVPTGLAFGTVTVVAEGHGYEVTTLRKDVETDGRRAIVSFGTDWAADAARRDFTLNALYCGADGELFDPLGGLEDCLSGRVRFIGDAATRIAEDRLRVFRFFRFSASHGGEQFDAEGLRACAAAADTLGPVSAERIGHEMMRMLSLRRVARTVQTMVDCRILVVGQPVLELLSAYETLAPHPEAAARLSLLAREVPPVKLQEDWRLSNATIARAERIGAAADLVLGGQVDAARYRFADCLLAALPAAAAIGGWTGTRADELKQQLGRPAPEFPVRAQDLLDAGFKQGPALGKAIQALEAEWISSGFALDRAALMRLAAALKP